MAHPARNTSRSTAARFDPDRQRWFAPLVMAVFALALIVLFGSFLFSDKMLYMSDQIQAGVFFRSLLVESVAQQGEIPQWNPYIYGGMPYVDAFHGDIFYPLTFLKFFGSVPRMIGINLVIHIFLAGLFMYFCARQFKLGTLPSLLAASVYMFAGYLVSLVAPGHDGKIFVTTLFPLVMLFLDRTFERRPLLNAALLGLVIGLIILSPHPQMAYFTLWAVALYSVFKFICVWRDARNVLGAVKPGSAVVVAVVLGLMISAIQFYPGYTYTTSFSPRADTKRGWDWATSWSMHQEEAMSLLIPEFAGVSTDKADTFYWGKNPFKDNSESVGALALLMAVIGLGWSKRREAWFFGGLAVFALLYALGATTPVFYLFFYLIPKVASLRAPSMIMFLFLFSTALLAGMGMQYLLSRTQERAPDLPRRLKWLLIGFPALLFVLALAFGAGGRGMLSTWCSIFYSEAGTTMVQQGISKFDLGMRNLPAIQTGAWMAFLFVGAASLLIWLYSTKKLGVAALCGLVALPMVDGVRFNSRFVNTFDQRQQWAQTPISQALAGQFGNARAVNLAQPQEDVLPYHDVEVVVGYHGNQLRWYDELLGGPGLTNVYNPRLLNLVGTQYLIAPSNQALPDGYFGTAPVTTVTTTGQQTLYHNANAFPRVFVAEQFQVLPDRSEIAPRILNGPDDLRSVALLEETPAIPISDQPLGGDSAWMISYAPDSLCIGLSLTQNRLVVLTDTWYDSWHASAGGQQVPILRADGAFRAVAVPAGTTELVMVYDSERYRTGRLVTWLALAMIAVIIGGHAWQRRGPMPATGDA